MSNDLEDLKNYLIDLSNEMPIDCVNIYNSGLEGIIKLETELKNCKASLKRERECVDFYASEINWDYITEKMVKEYSRINEKDMSGIEHLEMFGGKRARETQKLREKE